MVTTLSDRRFLAKENSYLDFLNKQLKLCPNKK